MFFNHKPSHKKYVVIHGLNIPEKELLRFKTLCAEICTNETEFGISQDLSGDEKYQALLVELQGHYNFNEKSDDLDFHALVENEDDTTKIAKILVQAVEQNKIIFSFNTTSSYKMVLSYTVSKYLARKLELTSERAYSINIALHEAITNAIIHGNLELQSNFNDLESFVFYYDEVEKRLKTPPYNKRRITVEVEVLEDLITVCVVNEGKGYNATEVRKKTLEEPSGKGMSMIASFAKTHEVLEDGKRIKMEFVR